ncbi:hypothetical protein BU24DRAFT_485855 [Aaosphaeria arxii CBS 175.79]|uniref:Cupredoxin n=1 Tax=Aaosphaeria arxii CBS 175.79 TaxID=1450172 RepID=A0A6A5XED4_9PLEO|nr:uncharacterized protein BU24DRAFT_485855 [Aaosphaeria arxii CBS 175.79]KAF2011253.1 hypothetical protein BU24DRAFT_485855 [Aaosphaeria arxii CBS 175.79]
MVSSNILIAALGALPLAFAGYYDAANATSIRPATPTGTASPSVATVAVGQNGLTFTPDTIHAEVGSEIVFQFFPKNHSVVQADFNNPCNPAADGGIFSGFVPSAQGAAEQTFKITVEDEKPIWLYCSALLPRPHCAQGMVAVINPPAHGLNTLDAFRQLAAGTNTSTSPTVVSGGQIQSGSPTPSNTPSSTTGINQPSETGAASSLTWNMGAVGGVLALVFGLLA